MSVCAITMAKDEADIVEPWLQWTLSQVDRVYVLDNASTDGTSEILQSYSQSAQVVAIPDPELAYRQAEKMTALAERALNDGFAWAVCADIDEILYATDGRRIGDYLAGLAPDVAYVQAPIFNHLPTSDDLSASERDHTERYGTWGPPRPSPIYSGWEPNPFRRIGWRQREHGALPKVTCRLRPGLEIRQGNHSAWAPGSGSTTGGLVVRHFSWRSEQQYVRKIANGYRAYAATNLYENVGAHWRMFGPPDDPTFAQRVGEHFRTWFLIDKPASRDDLIYDPAPLP